MANKLVTFFLDHKGAIGRAVVYIATAIVAPNDAVVQAIRTAFLGLSNAVITGDSISKTVVHEDAGDADDTEYHSDIDDRIVMKFVDAANQYHLIECPVPPDACFEDANISLDLKSNYLAAGQPIGDLMAAIEDNCVSQEGDALTLVEAWFDRKQADL